MFCLLVKFLLLLPLNTDKQSFQSWPSCHSFNLERPGQPHHMVIFLPLIPVERRQWHPTPVLLPGKSHGWRSLVGSSPWGGTESDTTERLHFHFSLSCIGEGNGNPLQCSCLENPRDGEAWWAAVYAVTQSRTGLKWLSSSSSNTNRCLLTFLAARHPFPLFQVAECEFPSKNHPPQFDVCRHWIHSMAPEVDVGPKLGQWAACLWPHGICGGASVREASSQLGCWTGGMWLKLLLTTFTTKWKEPAREGSQCERQQDLDRDLGETDSWRLHTWPTTRKELASGFPSSDAIYSLLKI